MTGGDKDKWTFKVHSGTKDNVWYDVVMRFKNLEAVLKKHIRNRKLWTKDGRKIDLKKLAQNVLWEVDIEMRCSDPSFVYWGYAYTLSRPKYDAIYGEKENRPPRIRNPRQYGGVCKHIHTVYNVLPFYTTTMAKWLKQFHLRTINKLSAEVTREVQGMHKAANALGKRLDLGQVNR